MALTKVHLLSVPLEKDYSHTLYFGTASEQYSYFYGRRKKEYSDLTYQRKDGIIRLPEHIDVLYKNGINYVAYQNPEYNNKWFYAFITDMQYVNDGRTDITIATDCIQTWMFEKVIKPCFIEREHAKYDVMGLHTIDEGLEMGEYISNKHSKSGYAGSKLSVVIATTKEPDGTNVHGMLYNNIYSGLNYYTFDSRDTNGINAFLASYDENGHGDAISCMFLAPENLALVREDHFLAGSGWAYAYYINPFGMGDLSGASSTIILSTEKLDGYTPRNQKLMCYPYRYLLVANNSGGSVPMKYEKFYKKTDSGSWAIYPPMFVIEGVITPGCSIRMVPLNYNGIDRNDEEGINMGKFPILNWTSDVYTNWLTQNGVNIALSIATGVVQTVAGIATAAATGGVGAAVGAGVTSGGVTTIANTLAQIHTQSFSPPQARGNLNAGDVVTASDNNDFHFYDMSIKKEYAQILDEYFDMYGYKAHRVKIPEENHRENYWFTKTIDANITGEIPQADLQIIKDCYNRGITYWKNPSNFKNYGVANGTV